MELNNNSIIENKIEISKLKNFDNNINKKNDCIFCFLPQKRILFENDLIIIFEDINPIAKIHLLCIPKTHIKNINSLTINDLNLLNEMKNNSLEYIMKHYNNISENNIILGFHIPPFTSVNHLHMHCLVPPFNNCFIKFCKVNCVMRYLNTVINNIQNNN